MYNKKNILIGTTAINRPELHNDNIKEWHNWINNIDKSKYEPFKVIVEKYKWHHIDENNQSFEVCFDDFSIVKNEEKIVFDIAFIIIHGPPGEDGLIQSYFQLKIFHSLEVIHILHH